MGINIAEWEEKLPGIERSVIVKWITAATQKTTELRKIEQFMTDMYYWQSANTDEKKEERREKFKKNWLFDPETMKAVEAPVEKELPVKDDEDDKNDKVEVSEEVKDEIVEDVAQAIKKGDLDATKVPMPEKMKEEIKEEFSEELGKEEEDMPEELETDLAEVPAAEEPEEEVLPYDNPDLSNVDLGKPDDEEEEDPEGDEEVDVDPDDLLEKPDLSADDQARYDKYEQSKRHQQPNRASIFPKEDMVSKQVHQDEYSKVLEPHRFFLDMLREDSHVVEKFARTATMENHPPYMQVRDYLINHAIKDPNNTKVLINVVDEHSMDGTIQAWKTLPECVDLTRTLVEQAMFTAAIYNFDAIIEQMEKDRSMMTSLIYMLEIYCETKQRSPFEFNIPKQSLINSMRDQFEGINELLRKEIMREIIKMRNEVVSEMGGVSSAVTENMSKFDSQIGDAIERVIWKVKTDVEETNLEDIKRSQYFLLNKRSSSYSLGAVPCALIAIMVDDLERRVMNENFKIDNIKEFRRYNVSEMQKRMGYKVSTFVNKGVSHLVRSKIVKMYKDGSFSLTK